MAQPRYCPVHNVTLDPSWEVCPYCLKEGRVPPPGAAAGPAAFPAPPPPLEQMRVGADTVVRPGAGEAGPGGLGPADATRRAGPGVGVGIDQTRRAPAAPGGPAGETVIERPPEARAWLVVREGEGAGQWHPISDEISIGRDRENNIVLIEGKVSRFHAKLRLEKDEEGHDTFVVWDLASRNGTRVNGEKVRAPLPVKENDTIQVGNTVFVLKVVE
jgi:hypothetical protein